MNNSSSDLQVSLELVNNKLHFIGASGKKEKVSIDYIPPLGDNLGHTSLELLLLSLSSCITSSILVLLRKKDLHIKDVKVFSVGNRKETHPTGFSYILVEIEFSSSIITDDDMKSTLVSAEKICPVWSMLQGNVSIEIKFKIKNYESK